MKRLLALLLGLCCLLLAACGAQPAAPEEDFDAGMARSTPTPLPSPSPSPSPGFAVNPVSAFFAAYRSRTGAARTDYRSARLMEESIDSIEALLRFDRHFSRIMRPNASVGRLSQSGEGYADSLIGAATGSGQMWTNDALGSDAWLFEFDYADGLHMRGSLSDGRLAYTLHHSHEEEYSSIETDAESGESYEIISTETVIEDAHVLCILRLDETGAAAVYAEPGHVEFSQLMGASLRFMTGLPAEAPAPLNENDMAEVGLFLHPVPSDGSMG